VDRPLRSSLHAGKQLNMPNLYTYDSQIMQRMREATLYKDVPRLQNISVHNPDCIAAALSTPALRAAPFSFFSVTLHVQLLNLSFTVRQGGDRKRKAGGGE